MREAEELDTEVFKTSKRLLGEEDPSRLASMANLASTYGLKAGGRRRRN